MSFDFIWVMLLNSFNFFFLLNKTKWKVSRKNEGKYKEGKRDPPVENKNKREKI